MPSISYLLEEPYLDNSDLRINFDLIAIPPVFGICERQIQEHAPRNRFNAHGPGFPTATSSNACLMQVSNEMHQTRG